MKIFFSGCCGFTKTVKKILFFNLSNFIDRFCADSELSEVLSRLWEMDEDFLSGCCGFTKTVKNCFLICRVLSTGSVLTQ